MRNAQLMMRKKPKSRNLYYVDYGGFRNSYRLCYAPDSDDVPSSEGWERITRKEAEALAREERARAKQNPSFSGYADSYIWPYGFCGCKGDVIAGYYSKYHVDGVFVVEVDPSKATEKARSVIRTWKVYGAFGHRQRESFHESFSFETNCGECFVEVMNADITGTNDYTIIRITGPSAELCENSLFGQISDGVFENSKVGDVVEVFADE